MTRRYHAIRVVIALLAVSFAGVVMISAPAAAQQRGCPDATEMWLGLRVCEETGDQSGYDRKDFGSSYRSKEDDIIDGLPQVGGRVHTPYTCTPFDVEPNGTAATDIEHIVSLAEAYDSGLAQRSYRAFAGDLDNLTIAAPAVNRNQKSDRDAGEWTPARNRAWFAIRVIVVKRKYRLSVDPAERDALAGILRGGQAGEQSWCGQ